MNIFQWLMPSLLTWATRTSLASRCHHLPNPLASSRMTVGRGKLDSKETHEVQYPANCSQHQGPQHLQTY